MYVLGFIIGIGLGSFTKAWADRSLEGKSIRGRSYCESCKHQLKWYDLFPIFSYLILLGKCRYCRKEISLEYPLVELAFGALLALVFWQSNLRLFSQPFAYLILDILNLAPKVIGLSVFIAIFLTDFKKGLIPDKITYPGVISVLMLLLVASIYKIALIYLSLSAHPIGKYLLPPYSDYFIRHALIALNPLSLGLLSAVSMFMFFWAIIFFTKGKGMGGGDLKLAVFMGLLLGFPGILVALMIAFLSGSLAGLLLIFLKKRNLRQTIPFGPFLSLGGITTLLWGRVIVDWYLGLSNIINLGY